MPKKDKDRKVERPPTGRTADPDTPSPDGIVSPEPSTELTDGRKPRLGFPIVGIGASAGGLQAFREFLEAVPPKTGMAFVLVPHLDPTHQSLMVDLLSQRTSMPLREAKQGMKVEADHVYVIPPAKYMEIREGRLHLVNPGDPPARRTAIDRFFQSLAQDQREMAVGIVLSGTGSHGTSGLKEIKLAGGLVMIQDPQTAEYDQMPRSAIDAGLADYVLAPKNMAASLVSYAQHPYVNHGGKAEEEEEEDGAFEDHILRILAVLRTRTRYDFRAYRKKMVARRVRRRMGLRQIEDPAVYLDHLREDPEEIQRLYKDMLIGVTGFFREPEAFQVLQEEVLPYLVAKANADFPVRVWVPGCATGEEAYSLAIVLIEQFQAMQKPANFQIFATDIDLESINKARDGRYPESIAGDMSPERLRRFFVSAEGFYHIRREVRDAVVFAPQNVIADAPFSRIDLISCRNLMIYLEVPVQQRLVSLFHFSLRDGGYLFLGSSESVGRHLELFEPVSKKWRVFRRLGDRSREQHSVEVPVLTANHNPLPIPEAQGTARISLTEVMRRMLLDSYAPAAILVNDQGHVQSFHGSTSDYLEFPTGELSRDLMTLLRSGMRSKVRAALEKSSRAGIKVETAAHVKREDKYVPCRIQVFPAREPKDVKGLFLITFQDQAVLPQGSVDGGPPQEIDDSTLLTQLESDLKATREDLQSTIEELESSNEELRAANEEMMSMNEELQSANEELETSKEELQSLNEELTTVNHQLNEKVEELDAAYTDLNNILTSSDIATVILDRQMRIRKFTAPSRKLFSLVSGDMGRPLSDLSFRFNDPNLLQDAEKVLEQLSPSEEEVASDEGHIYIRRILPYRASGNRIDGVTITFMDITDRKRQETELNEAFAGLEDEVSRRTSALTMIRDMAVQANAARSVEEILEISVRRICDYVGWESGYAYCAPRDEDDDEEVGLVPVASWNTKMTRDSDRLRNVFATTPLSSGADMASRAWRSGQAQWTSALDQDLPSPVAEAAGKLEYNFCYAYPVVSNRRVVALLLFLGKNPGKNPGKNLFEPRPQTVELLSSIANQISLVVEREKLSRQIHEMSAYDQIRLSQDLHDAIGQQLAGLSMSAEVISRTLAQKESDEAPAMAEVVQGLRETLQQIRLLARGLAEIPIGPGTLAIALEQLCMNNPAVLHSNLKCRANVDRTVDIEDPDVAIHMYRIAQEAVHNAVNHSHGKTLEITLQQDEKDIVMSIQDDGIGLAKSPRLGMGLRTMRHRARLIGASLEVRSERGTRITLRVPKGEVS